MNKFTRFFAIMLVLTMMLSVVAFPASAALGSGWSTEFATFPVLRRTNSGTYPGYTKALQRFLMCYNDNFKRVLEQNGGIDGRYGGNTEDVVIAYQIAEGLSNDGVVGPGTWTQISNNLSVSESNAQRYVFSIRNQPVIRVDRIMYPTYTYLYYLENGSLGGVFHTE